MNYSPYQIAIFDHVRAQWGALKRRRAGDTGAQPRNLVVQATAGSGKTTSIVHMCRQIPDARVEVVSFNSRVARDISGKLPSNASSVTLHAVGKRALEEYFGRRFMEEGKRGGNDGELAKNKTGRIVAKLKTEGVVGQFVNTSQVCKLVSRAKGVGIVPAGAAVGRKSPVAAVGVTPDEDGVWMDLIEAAEIPVKYGCHGELIRAAREVLRVSLESASACIDFDDMLYVAVVLPDLRFPRRDVVAVDELQDLDPMQRRMVVRMCEDALFVGVGDRMQSLYSFRGADSDSMDRTAADLRCDELPLSISYRCPASHVRLAREITHLIEARTDAPEGVIDHVKLDDCPSLLKSGDAVICRKNANLIAFAYQLLRARVPFRMVGRDAAGEVAQVLRGTGVPTAEGAMTRLRARLARLEATDARDPAVPDEGSDATRKLREQVETLAVVLDNMADRYQRDDGSVPDFSVEDVAREIEDLFAEEGSGVTLSSIHRAKGGEWDRVFWLDPDNCALSPRASDVRVREMMCVRFVATTRARDALYFVR